MAEVKSSSAERSAGRNEKAKKKSVKHFDGENGGGRGGARLRGEERDSMLGAIETILHWRDLGAKVLDCLEKGYVVADYYGRRQPSDKVWVKRTGHHHAKKIRGAF